MARIDDSKLPARGAGRRPASSAFLAGDAGPLIALAGLVVVSKIPTLHTPYYWDEMSWAGAAHQVWEAGLLIVLPGMSPPETFFGHPPGLHALMAAVWMAAGDSIAAAHAVSLAFATCAVIFTYLLGRTFYDRAAGFFAALLLWLSPLFFAQSGMFLADVPVTALGLMSVYFAVHDRHRAFLVSAAGMVLVKETGAAVVTAIAVYVFATSQGAFVVRAVRSLKYAAPVGVLVLFVVWQKVETGSFFWIFGPEVDAHLIEFDPAIRWRKYVRVTEWLFVNEQRYLLTALVLLQLAASREFRTRREWWIHAPTIVMSGCSFYVLYFLPRYLLPALPHVYLAGMGALMALPVPRAARTVAGVLLIALAAWSLPKQPFEGNAEFNLRYVDVVAAHREACRFIETDLPGHRVTTAWPHSLQLMRPFLGYVHRPVQVHPLEKGPAGANDVILVSVPGTHDSPQAIDAEARARGWRLLRRFGDGPIVTAVYHGG